MEYRLILADIGNMHQLLKVPNLGRVELGNHIGNPEDPNPGLAYPENHIDIFEVLKPGKARAGNHVGNPVFLSPDIVHPGNHIDNMVLGIPVDIPEDPNPGLAYSGNHTDKVVGIPDPSGKVDRSSHSTLIVHMGLATLVENSRKVGLDS